MIVPFAHDHFENARIITSLGIGTSIPLRSLTRRSLARKLLQLQRSRKVQERCLYCAAKSQSRMKVDDIVDRVLEAITGSPAIAVMRSSGLEEDTVWELLNSLASNGLQLSVEGSQLNCYAPKGALTNELRESIVRHKSQIIAVLRGE